MPPQLKEKLDLNIYTPACLADTGKDWAGLLILMIMILIFFYYKHDFDDHNDDFDDHDYD